MQNKTKQNPRKELFMKILKSKEGQLIINELKNDKFNKFTESDSTSAKVLKIFDAALFKGGYRKKHYSNLNPKDKTDSNMPVPKEAFVQFREKMKMRNGENSDFNICSLSTLDISFNDIEKEFVRKNLM
jgi:hypothetical protein